MNKPTANSRPVHSSMPVDRPPIGETIAVSIPDGHVGPVVLPQTGRTIWWTGRVAIGLRYDPQCGREPPGRYAEWLQKLVLLPAPPGGE